VKSDPAWVTLPLGRQQESGTACSSQRVENIGVPKGANAATRGKRIRVADRIINRGSDIIGIRFLKKWMAIARRLNVSLCLTSNWTKQLHSAGQPAKLKGGVE